MIQKSKAAVIPISTINADPEHIWKEQLRNLITDTDTLLNLVNIHDPEIRTAAKQACQLFPLKVTHSYVNNIEKGNIHDPLLRQILPLHAEFVQHADYSNDPTGDLFATKSAGLLHKYHGRVLIILTSACAIHCRYCFRREYPYNNSSALRKEWQNIKNYLENNTNVHEVILSGGDPLMLDNEKLAELLSMINGIPHIKRIRIHSRLPIVLPARVTTALCKLLAQQRCQMILVVHSNHARELSTDVKQAIDKLKNAEITIFNQAVLLAGINDDIETLKALCEELFTIGIIPYYLHILDKVQGTTHFEVSESRINQLYRELITVLPGYLVPKLVQDLPKQNSKTPWRLS